MKQKQLEVYTNLLCQKNSMQNLLDLSERRYVITGAASGIGRTASILLSQYGAKLLLIDINEDGLNKTREMCVLDNTSILKLDLSDINSFKPVIFDNVNTFGKLNGVVHLAGLPYLSPLKTVNIDKCEIINRVNALAAVELSKLFINKKIYAGEAGSIVLVSSVYGIVGSAANIGYALSKGAIISATKALAIELASKKIRVNCVAPGFIRTEMMDAVSSSFDDEYVNKLEMLHPLGLGTADNIAQSILFLLSDMSSWMTGAVLNVDGGFTAQ